MRAEAGMKDRKALGVWLMAGSVVVVFENCGRL
jgi:hypothetical protein